mmetsp:Transcript_15635/g.20662  ORF Transcript_15635/g.20662 Transcript_15635/m.20662 type:complete len:523 (+) Transcript_15635:162-1730(+)
MKSTAFGFVCLCWTFISFAVVEEKMSPFERRKLSPRKEYNWTAAQERMIDVLRHSIKEQHNESKATLAIRSALNDRSHTVWIIAGKIYVDRSFLGTMKNELHLRLIRAVLIGAKRYLQSSSLEKQQLFGMNTLTRSYLENTLLTSNKLKTGVLMYSYEASATGRSKCDSSLPLFVIAKKFHEQCGILIPNPYFDILDAWSKDYTRLLAIGEKRAWEQRNPRVFWRGKVRGHDAKEDCGRDAGNFARISAAALTLQYPKRFDVRPTDCETRHGRQCDSVFKMNDLERKAAARNCRLIKGHFSTHAKFANFKFLLDLPGSTSGSYSRNLNHLWLLGAVVMTWTGPLLDHQGAMQWYTPALQDGHTHLVVDKNSAPVLAESIALDDDRRQYLITNARNVATKFLCPNCIIAYIITIFKFLFDHFAPPPLYNSHNLTHTNKDEDSLGYLGLLNSDDAQIQAKRHDLLYTYKCSTLHLVQVIGDHVSHTHHRRNIPPWRVPTRPIHGISACELLNSGGRKPLNVKVG